jgi:hypothetical protein
MQRSLSSHMRDQVENWFEGPIPPEERERIRIVEAAEKSYDRSLTPVERAMRSLRYALAELERDSALLEASRQLVIEASDHNSKDGWEKQHERRRLIALECATWAQTKLEAVLKALQPAEKQEAA